jgi:CBS-domain-containing membrane protein
MSREVLYCFDEEEVEDVARNMADQQIRRLPVVDRDKHLVGIVSLADLAVNGKTKATADAVAGISRPGGRHDQTLH